MVEACRELFPAGDVWLDLQNVAPRLTAIRQGGVGTRRGALGGPGFGAARPRRPAAAERSGRALLVLAEPTEAGIAEWVLAELAAGDTGVLLLTGSGELAGRLGAVSVPSLERGDRGMSAAGEDSAALPDARFAYDSLPPAMQWRFRALGAFAAGHVDRALAARVLGDDPSEAERGLDELRGCGALEKHGGCENFLPPYVQQHGGWRLAANGEVGAARERHAEAVLEFMGRAEAEHRAGGEGGRAAIDRYAENWAQIAAAWDYLAGRDDFRGRAAADAFLGAAPGLLACVAPPALRAAWLDRALRPAAIPGRGRWEARHLALLAEAQQQLGQGPRRCEARSKRSRSRSRRATLGRCGWPNSSSEGFWRSPGRRQGLSIR